MNINYHSKCLIIDDESPNIVKAFITPDDRQCVQVDDNVQTQSVAFNGTEVPAWPASQVYFCTQAKLGITEIIARDSAGNINEMLSINLNISRRAIKTITKETFTAFVSKELNPHKDIEGIVLTSTEPIKQLRIAGSPEFADSRSLKISDRAMQELDGQYTVVVKYYGQHTDKQGQLYVFAVNRGLLATFDVRVDRNDMKLSVHQQNVTHGTYELVLKNPKLVDMGSNTLVKSKNSAYYECEKTLTQLIFRSHYVPRAATTIC